MADILNAAGQYYFLNGLRPQIKAIDLVTSADVVISSVTGLAGTEFETAEFSSFTDNSPLFNNVVIDFTIEAADIGETAHGLIFKDSLGNQLCRTDLETTKLLDTEGTFRFAVGSINIRT